MNVSLVFLTLNEIEGLKSTFPMVPEEFLSKAFAIDGGSTDGTCAFFQEHGISVLGQSKRGRGEAMRLAFQNSEADALIFFSPDGNEDPKDLVKFQPLLEQGYDLVIASRMMYGAVNEEDSQILKLRKWANNLFNLGVNLLWKNEKYITDSINGFRAITREAFQRLALDEKGFTIEYQMTIRCLKLELRIAEFPTHEHHRIGGESGAKAIPTGLRFVRCFLKEMLKGSFRSSD